MKRGGKLDMDFEKIINEFAERAKSFYEDNEKLADLIDEFGKKIKDSEILENVGTDLKLTLEMIIDWKNGDYKDLSKDSIVIIIIGFLYVLSPANIMPKLFPLKYVDDILVLLYIIGKIKTELKKYKKWRSKNGLTDMDNEDGNTYIDLN